MTLAEGIIFFWMSWTLWIIVAFLMKKSKQRNILNIWMLLSISIAQSYFTINSLEVSALFLILLLGSLVAHAYLLRNLYHLYVAFTIMVGFTAILLLDINLPVLLFIPKIFFIPLLFSILIIISDKGLHNRILNGILGLVSGEILYSMILFSYGLDKTIGDKYFFDVLVLTIFVVTCIDFIQKTRFKLKIYETM